MFLFERCSIGKRGIKKKEILKQNVINRLCSLSGKEEAFPGNSKALEAWINSRHEVER